MTTRIAISVAGLLIAGSAFAQTGATRDPGKIEAGAYAVEPQHTQVMFAVSHLGFTTFRGRFDTISGSLQFDPRRPAASTFDVAVETASVDTPVAPLNDELRGEQWLDARRFPQITFRSTGIIVTGPHAARVTGDVTLHGVTQLLTLAATLQGAGVDPITHKYTVGFELSGRIRRSDFGVKTDLPLVGDDVELTISAAFEKKE